jgi:uncharacterized protein
MSAGIHCLVMAKPAGPGCSLRCGYCYYLRKESLFPPGPWRMTEGLLERYVEQRLRTAVDAVVHFEWHGGEPTLLGVDYFRSVVRMQKAHRGPGQTITNGIQTNGMHLDSAWARLLCQEGFSVGLSLDGPADLHDMYRRTPDGTPTHGRVLESLRMLKEHRVFCNVLCVLHAGNAAEPDRVYDFFRSEGVTHLQFLPLVVPAGPGRVSHATASPDTIGRFFCRIFDRWMAQDVGRIVIQTFDEALRPLYGAPHALCVHRETCGDVAVLEHNGDFYACDHFVDADHLIGKLGEQALGDLMAHPRMKEFGAAKRDSLPSVCRVCDVLASCNGGCPKDRIATAPDGESGLNYLCPAYTMFFRHSRPGLARLASHMKAGRTLRSFRV